MMVFLLLSLLVGQAHGAPPCPPSKDATGDLRRICDSVVPKCFEPPAGLKGSSHPEAIIRDLFAGLSDEEIQARLVFAEALASGESCVGGPQGAAITQAIAWTIANRVRDPAQRYGRGAREVVFRKAQFRSSFGSCDVAKRRELLCPSGAGERWRDHWNASLAAVRQASAGAGNPMPKVRHYFFGKHFDDSQDQCRKWKGVMPAWSKPPHKRVEPQLAGLVPGDSCAMFFDVR